MARRLSPLVALVVLLALSPAASPARSAECTSGSTACFALLALRNGGLMPYYRNYPLGTTLPDIKRAIVVIHGHGRDVASYFTTLVGTTRTAGLSRETLIVAPHFQPPNPTPPDGQLAWRDGWEEGALSTDRGPLVPRRSSFEVIDQFVTVLGLKSTYPNLREIVVTGNSAGGQFTQRYAATSPLGPPAGIRLRYVVTNPGSYMYLNGYRKIDGRFRGLNEFQRLKCRGWDNYRYGLDKRDGYAGRFSANEVRTQYRARLVTYLLGENDTKHEDLDQGCEANLQGGNRLVRGKRFFEFMNKYYAPHKHAFQLVPGAGHGAGDIFMKPEARSVLFPPLPLGNRR